MTGAAVSKASSPKINMTQLQTNAKALPEKGELLIILNLILIDQIVQLDMIASADTLNTDVLIINKHVTSNLQKTLL